MKTIKSVFRFVLKVLKWGFLSFVVLAIVSALYNLTLPTESKVKDILTQNAFNTERNGAASKLVAQFLAKRSERREKSNLSDEMIRYEQKREWLEGLAKYAELKIGVMASENQSYKHINEIETAPGFKNYKARLSHFNQQIGDVKRIGNRPAETRFYYTGMLQAVMLDRLMPEWKNDGFKEGVYLENLLERAVKIG